MKKNIWKNEYIVQKIGQKSKHMLKNVRKLSYSVYKNVNNNSKLGNKCRKLIKNHEKLSENWSKLEKKHV